MNGNARPLVSVILCSFQAGNSLAAAIGSIIEQTYENWELLVIDDGSSDGSVAIARAFNDERVTVITDGRNLGLATRLNQGVALAKGEYIARMDADDISFPDRLEVQVEYLREHYEVDLVASSALVFGADREPIGILPVETNHSKICARPWHGFPMPHPTWMGRRAWFQNNPYDVTARKAQDQKLLYATYARSHFGCISQPLLAYRYERLSLAKTVVGRYHFLRGVAAKGNKRHLVRAVVTHLLAAVRDIFAMIVSEDDRVIRGRVRGASPEIIARWQALRRRLDEPQQIDSNASNG